MRSPPGALITNTRTKRILCRDERICASPWLKFRGLMFSRQKNLVFLFARPSYISLHMLFVFFPIDVLFLDSKKKVVEIKQHILPFTAYVPAHAASAVIELSDGVVKKTGTRIGDTIHISTL